MKNNSNWTLRWPRTSREAIGYELKNWHFPPDNPDVGDKAVAVVCIIITIALPVAAWLFQWKLGG